MDFMTTKEAALKWGLTNRMVQYYCKEGKIQKAENRKHVATSKRCKETY